MSRFKKYIWVPTILLPLLILFGLSISYGQEEEILLDNPAQYDSKQRTAVLFPHELHMGEYDCLDCHHKYEDGENILEEDELEEDNPEVLCSACHNLDAKMGLQEAFHRQCIKCHIDLRKANQATAPELCGECHLK